MANYPYAKRNKKYAAIVARVLELDIDEINPHTVSFEWRAPTAGIGVVNLETDSTRADHAMYYYDDKGIYRKRALTFDEAKALKKALQADRDRAAKHEAERFTKTHDLSRVVRQIVPRLRELQQAPHGLHDEWDHGYYVGLERAIQEIVRYADEMEA